MSNKRIRQDYLAADDDGIASEINTAYGDMVTFCMALFILLFVITQNNKDTTFFSEMRVKFGAKKIEQEKVLTSESLLVSRVEGYVKQENLEGKTKILVDEKKISFILDSPVLFQSGQAELLPEGKKIIDGLAEVLKLSNNPIIIEGHTDDDPIKGGKYNSNWELSFSRAFSIVKYLIDVYKFSPNQLSAIGYGEYQPIADNDTPENKARNRRIAVNIIKVIRTEAVSK